MLHASDLEELPQLPAPVLTAYLDTDPANARNQGRKGPATWLLSEARKLAERLGPQEREACVGQAGRVREYLLDRCGQGSRGLLVFAGPRTWRMLRLQVHMDEELYWGAPALGQLLWLMDEHQPCGVVVVSRSGARFFRYHMGEIEQDPARPMHLDTSQWRERSLVMGVGVEQDRFERRAAAQYQRFWEQVAAECRRWSEYEHLDPVLLQGESKAIESVNAALPEALAARVLSTTVQANYESESEILARAEPLMVQWKREREREKVMRLLERPANAVIGRAATLTALQQGRLREVVAARNLRGRLRQCPGCGWVDATSAVCPQCGQERPAQSPRAVLPQLARTRAVRMEIVAGEAAARLERESEGLAGWLQAA
ncbi:MAG: VLRF1 family aeRF1-type release factor [Terriglobales bacterium]